MTVCRSVNLKPVFYTVFGQDKAAVIDILFFVSRDLYFFLVDPVFLRKMKR